MRMFRNTRENKVNELKKTRSTWDVISVTGSTDTRSAESSYLNKNLNSNTLKSWVRITYKWNSRSRKHG